MRNNKKEAPARSYRGNSIYFPKIIISFCDNKFNQKKESIIDPTSTVGARVYNFLKDKKCGAFSLDDIAISVGSTRVYVSEQLQRMRSKGFIFYHYDTARRIYVLESVPNNGCPYGCGLPSCEACLLSCSCHARREC